MRNRLLVLIFLMAFYKTNAQIVKNKLIDNGGSGLYKAIAITEKKLPDFVIYRPQNITKAVKKEGKLPVVVWANGGCMNSSIHQERLLSELASHGYIILAIGALQMTVEERVHESTPANELLKALDWISEYSKTKGNDYYKNVDLAKIAAGGHSCGGAQTFRIADDPRIKTYLILNAGMGDMTMAEANSESLKNLHGQIIYMLGGESDIAFKNAVLDFDRISHVPVVFANHATAGHSATFSEEFGGSFAQMSLDWLDWQFKGKDNADIFLQNDLSSYPDWTIKSKGFKMIDDATIKVKNFAKPELEFTCELRVNTDTPIKLGITPHGKRVIIPITGGTFEGPDLKGTVLNGGADYQYVSMNSERTELNAIYTIKTDDGVLIHVRNIGLIYAPKDKTQGMKEFYFRAAPKFEAPIDSKYAWLNNALFVCVPEDKEEYISIQVWKVL